MPWHLAAVLISLNLIKAVLMLARIEKREIYDAVNAALEVRVSDVKDLINRYQEAANTEEKNTAGDKHEVTKAQMQWEVEKANRQLSNLLEMRHIMLRVDPVGVTETVSTGSVVKTDQGYFFVAIAMGRIMVDHEPVMCISGISPIGKIMFGKKAGDTAEFNDKKYVIEKVY